MFKRIISIIGCLLTILGLKFATEALITPAYAEEDNKPAVWLQISPVSTLVPLDAGTIHDYTFQVENRGTDAFSYKVYARPYYVNTESGDYGLDFTTENNYTQVTHWITFKDVTGNWVDTATYRIEPGKTQDIAYRITVPKDVPSGSQHATIFAESINDSNTGGIKTASRVGLILFGRTSGETINEAQVVDFNIPGFITGGNLTASAKVKNTGNTDFTTSYVFSAYTVFGKEITNQQMAYSVLPDTTRPVTYEWEETPFFGIYKINFRITALDVVEEHSKIVIIMPLPIIIIVLMLLTIIIVWIIMQGRKRRARKSRLLV